MQVKSDEQPPVDPVVSEPEMGADQKLRLSLVVLRQILDEPGAPRFSDFWKIRRDSLELFKANISLKVRADLWKEFAELSGEARKLKEIFDEQSAFAVEQIELAIQAIERDLAHKEMLIEGMPEGVKISQISSLQKRERFYITAQKEIEILSSLASKMKELREELIKTPMRIRIKNQLFDRLSGCGDQIFPKRREMIEQLSSSFLEDLRIFTGSLGSFEEEVLFHAVRAEIKALQEVAKALPLSPRAFAYARSELSRCWSDLSILEQERKVLLQRRQEMDLKREEAEEIKKKNRSEKQKKWLALSQEARGDLEKLYEALSACQERKLELKRELEEYRKALGGSGFDFEKAMMYRELIESEKEQLLEVSAAMEEIEKKISHYEISSPRKE